MIFSEELTGRLNTAMDAISTTCIDCGHGKFLNRYSDVGNYNISEHVNFNIYRPLWVDRHQDTSPGVEGCCFLIYVRWWNKPHLKPMNHIIDSVALCHVYIRYWKIRPCYHFLSEYHSHIHLKKQIKPEKLSLCYSKPKGSNCLL